MNILKITKFYQVIYVNPLLVSDKVLICPLRYLERFSQIKCHCFRVLFFLKLESKRNL